MKALVIGATGATGKDLVDVLLRDPAYAEVVTFVRRKGDIVHPKLREILTDFDQLDAVSDAIRGDVWFCCMGTTLRAAGSQEAQRHIDLEIPLAFAGIARRNGVSGAVLVSSYGASAGSKAFYLRLKGELEEGIDSLGFDPYVIFRPGMLQRKNTDRFGEKVINAALKILNSIGLVRKYRPLPTTVLAERLADAPKVCPSGRHVVELHKIFAFPDKG